MDLNELKDREYSRACFELLAKRFQEAWFDHSHLPFGHRIDDKGFWPDLQAEAPYCWSPLCDLDDDGGPARASENPALPFPFTARQLAAFFLDGYGAAWCEALGGWGGDPAISLIRGRDRDTALEVYRAELLHPLQAAWKAYGAALALVGPLNEENLVSVDYCPRGTELRERAEADCVDWRKRMVTQLLAPKPRTQHPAAPTNPVEGCGLSKRERQIRAILEAIAQHGHPIDCIPVGRKRELRKFCNEQHPQLFGAGNYPFDDAWKQASIGGRLAIANKTLYRRA